MPKGAEIIPPPRILLLSASVGVGHLRAAEAVELALCETAPDAFIRNLDVMELTNRAFGRLYSRGYLGVMNRALISTVTFTNSSTVPSAPRHAIRPRSPRLAMDQPAALHSNPESGAVGFIINTHFLPAEIVATLRRQGTIDTPQVTVTTDFDTHRMWVHPPCEHYFTATEEGSRYLQYWGVPADDASVTGIPIHPVFDKRRTKRPARPSMVWLWTGRL